MLGQSFDLYHYLQTQMKDCEKQIEAILEEYTSFEQPQQEDVRECPRSKKVKARKNMISIDIEDYAYRIWGVNLARVYGISDAALLRLVGGIRA
ncbi:hypothetical protein [Bacteroides zoogleoformans]|uniref:hypothetical protein n=1 Tax=Bacteroides zoogleoformans TaxID=28119 RepID=UPI00248D7251|nr:hypothetical protein [Bacteroides zoogleoformans]